MVLFPSRGETLARYHGLTGKSEAERRHFVDASYSPQPEQIAVFLVVVNGRMTPVLARAVEIEG